MFLLRGSTPEQTIREWQEKFNRWFNSPSLGNAGNTIIEEDGTMVFYNDATVWEDVLPSSVTVGTSGANVPTFTVYNGGLKAYEFLGATNMKEINIGFQLPHGRKPDSDIYPHIHIYVPSDASGGVVKFGIEYTWSNIDQTGAITPSTITSKRTFAVTTINNNAIINFGPITGTGKGISSIFMMRLYRNPLDSEDTFGSSVWLKSADIHVEKDMLGSREEYTK